MSTPTNLLDRIESECSQMTRGGRVIIILGGVLLLPRPNAPAPLKVLRAALPLLRVGCFRTRPPPRAQARAGGVSRHPPSR